MKSIITIVLIMLITALSAQVVLDERYHTYEEIIQEISELQANHPDIVSVHVIGTTLGSDPYQAGGEEDDTIEELFHDDEALLALLEAGKDSDGDGIPDEMELSLGIDHLSEDTDGDGLSDGEELLLYGTNPAEDGPLPDGLYITNIDSDDQVTAGPQLLSGYGEEDTVIEFYDISGEEPVLIGTTKTDEKGLFMVMTDELLEGEYTIIAVDENGRDISSIIILNVAEFLGLQTPAHDPQVLDEGDRVISPQLGLIPAVSKALEANLMLVVTWQSSIFSQTIVADSTMDIGQSIVITPQNKLNSGKHVASWYAVDPVNNLRSGPGQIAFTVVPSSLNLLDGTKNKTIYAVAALISLLSFLLIVSLGKAGKPTIPIQKN